MLLGQLKDKTHQTTGIWEGRGPSKLQPSLDTRGSLGSVMVPLWLWANLIPCFSFHVGIKIIALCLLSSGRLMFIWGRNCLFLQFLLGSLLLANTKPVGSMGMSEEAEGEQPISLTYTKMLTGGIIQYLYVCI